MMTQQITTSVELITPEKASEYLSHNEENRPLDNRRLEYYVYQMQNGKWGFDPSNSIAFDENGLLLNGQHRLNALIKAGISAKFNVTRGAEKASRIYMDTGKPRNGGDVLTLHGYENGVRISSMINFLLGTLRKGRMPQASGSVNGKTRTFLTNEDTLREYETSPDLYQTVASIAQNTYKKYRLYTTAHLGGICMHLVKDKHHDLHKVEEFFEVLNDCAEKDYPYLVFLRRKIQKAKEVASRKDIFPVSQRLVMLSKAWNYFITGEDRKVIVCRPGEKMQFD